MNALFFSYQLFGVLHIFSRSFVAQSCGRVGMSIDAIFKAGLPVFVGRWETWWFSRYAFPMTELNLYHCLHQTTFPMAVQGADALWCSTVSMIAAENSGGNMPKHVTRGGGSHEKTQKNMYPGGLTEKGGGYGFFSKKHDLPRGDYREIMLPRRKGDPRGVDRTPGGRHRRLQ